MACLALELSFPVNRDLFTSSPCLSGCFCRPGLGVSNTENAVTYQPLLRLTAKSPDMSHGVEI